MTKLYSKNELIFAIVSILIYVLGSSVCDIFSDMVGISKIFTFPFLLVLSLMLFIWIKRQKLMTKYGLCKPKFSAKNFLLYIPLLILISTNFWFGVKLNFSLLESVLNVLSMLCVGFAEEIIFRGFLFRAMEKDNLKSAIIVSSVTFGFGHIINLFLCGFKNPVSNICQIFYAIAVGFLFVIIFYKGGSLLACIITHSLVNATSVFQNTQVVHGMVEVLLSVIITIVAIVYSIILIKTLTNQSKNLQSNEQSNDNTST